MVYQTIDWSKQPIALPHFTNGHLFYFSFFLTASVPQKENAIFITLSKAQQCLLKGNLHVEKILHGAIDISVYLKKSSIHAILLSSSGGAI